MRCSRREFLRLTGAAAVSGLASGSALAAPGDGPRPNVLFFSSDQHNPHFMSCDAQAPLGVHTPNMARLAREGVVFDNAYATVPVCAPTRASLVTGEYPETHGQLGNSSFLVEAGPGGKAPSVAHVFRAAGYNTALIGKTHSNMQGWDSRPDGEFEGKNLFLGFDYRLEGCCKSHHEDSPDMIPSPEVFRRKAREYKSRFPEEARGDPRPGWERAVLDGANAHDSKKRFKSRATGHAADNRDGVYAFDALDYLEDYARGDGPGASAPDVGPARNAGRRYALDRRNPFFLFLSVVQPHWPWVSPRMQDGIDFYAMYSGRPEDDRATYAHAGERRRKIALEPVRRELREFDMDGWPFPYGAATGRKQIPEAVRLARARYASAVSWVDHLLGLVMGKLDELPDPRNPGKRLSETTVVCYTSDHGDMMGEKNRFNKMVMFEGSARVPFIMRAPGVAGGGRSPLLLNHCDMFPTLAGLCRLGGKLRPGMAGRDLSRAVTEGDPAVGPDRTFSVNGIRRTHEHPAVVMSRTARHKFVRFGRDTRADGRPRMVLFDMEADPFETVNLADDPRLRNVVAEENEACNALLARFGVPPVSAGA
jgi:choline-sulfatase